MVSRMRYGRLLFAAFVVLALGGLYVAAGSGHAAASPAAKAASATVPVTTALRVCPAAGSAGVTAASVAMAAIPGSATAGQATVSRLTPGGSITTGQAIATISKPGLLHISPYGSGPLTKAQQVGQPGSSADVTTQNARVACSSTPPARWLRAWRWSRPARRAGHRAVRCPRHHFWFVGPGQGSAATIDLYLMNTDSQPADAQVSMLTDVTKGPPLLGNADNGITVPPHSMVVQSLSACCGPPRSSRST